MKINIISRVADRLGISRQAVSLYMRGTRSTWPAKHVEAARDELEKWKAELAEFDMGLPTSEGDK